MLCKIDGSLIEDARRILTLLCFAPRPLELPELVDGVAVETHCAKLNPQRRLQNADDIQQICLGLVDISLSGDDTTKIFRIAHFSVQEYLESERIQAQKAGTFSLTAVTANAEIAQICLIYLLEPGLSVKTLDICLAEKYPLALFAATYWYHHYERAENRGFKLDDFILKLFKHQRYSFLTWIKLHDPDVPWRSAWPSAWLSAWPLVEPDRELASIPSPVYYASLLGLSQFLHELISSKPQENEMTYVLPHSKSAIVNAVGGRYGNALQAASQGGRETVVQLLVECGADVNAPGGQFRNALQAASYGGLEKIV